ncbi:hypothetical protein CRENBAI_006784 [Crenichthys baileyi]|uniref:Uncharacterized protein n=1 Tax=Crenichthys baileyi TaxID=28760 RepID=A0AAV9SEP8_9TELE
MGVMKSQTRVPSITVSSHGNRFLMAGREEILRSHSFHRDDNVPSQRSAGLPPPLVTVVGEAHCYPPLSGAGRCYGQNRFEDRSRSFSMASPKSLPGPSFLPLTSSGRSTLGITLQAYITDGVHHPVRIAAREQDRRPSAAANGQPSIDQKEWEIHLVHSDSMSPNIPGTYIGQSTLPEGELNTSLDGAPQGVPQADPNYALGPAQVCPAPSRSKRSHKLTIPILVVISGHSSAPCFFHPSSKT